MKTKNLFSREYNRNCHLRGKTIFFDKVDIDADEREMGDYLQLDGSFEAGLY